MRALKFLVLVLALCIISGYALASDCKDPIVVRDSGEALLYEATETIVLFGNSGSYSLTLDCPCKVDIFYDPCPSDVRGTPIKSFEKGQGKHKFSTKHDGLVWIIIYDAELATTPAHLTIKYED